jgi:hypothetical protein
VEGLVVTAFLLLVPFFPLLLRFLEAHGGVVFMALLRTCMYPLSRPSRARAVTISCDFILSSGVHRWRHAAGRARGGQFQVR